jgi:hypothetical protein
MSGNSSSYGKGGTPSPFTPAQIAELLLLAADQAELAALLADYEGAGGFKGQDLSLVDFGLPNMNLTPLESAVRAVLVGRGQQYTITCAAKSAFVDGSTLILYLENSFNRLIDTVTLTFKPTESNPPPPPAIIGQTVASDVPLADCTTAQDCAERINGVLLSLPGNYIAYPGPTIVSGNTVEIPMSVPDEQTNGAAFDPIGTAIGVGVVSASKDGLGSLPLTGLQSLISALENQAADATNGARGVTSVNGQLGTASANFDVTNLACDSKGGFVLEFSLTGAAQNGSVSVRINQSTTNVVVVNNVVSPSGIITVQPELNAYGRGFATGDYMLVRMEALLVNSSIGARRVIIGRSTHYGKCNTFAVFYQGTDEITAIGVSVDSGQVFAATDAVAMQRRIAP